MGITISILSPKRGAGKSTLSMTSGKKETKQFDVFLENFLEIIHPPSIRPFHEELMLRSSCP